MHADAPTAPLAWIDGEFLPSADARVSVDDRGLLFADGIYEVVRVYDGAPFLLDAHLARWERSAAGILLDDPRTRDERRAVLGELLRRSGLREATLYGQLTRGAAPRAHAFPPAGTPPTEFWVAKPFKPNPPEWRADGIALASHPDERWAHCEWKTVALLPNCLAKEAARRAGAQEALLVAADGVVTECSASNAYCIAGGVLRTHPVAPRILKGITRGPILELARGLGLAVEERAPTLDEFRAADEAFISSTTLEAMPATRLDGAPIGDGRPGPWTRKLMHAFADLAASGSGIGAIAGH